MEPLRHTLLVRFGTYEVSFQSGEVRKAGVRIRVQQQPLKLLEVLLERPGEVVTREELRSRVWPNESFGDFDQAVNIAIAKLRSALGDAAENPRYIETLPKRGYRFIADVTVCRRGRPHTKARTCVRGRDWDRAWAPVPRQRVGRPACDRVRASAPRPEVGRSRQTPAADQRVDSSWPWRLYWVWRFFPSCSFVRVAVAPTAIRSLAVLPLENLSGDTAQNYFC